jgi:hypothetical protein
VEQFVEAARLGRFRVKPGEDLIEYCLADYDIRSIRLPGEYSRRVFIGGDYDHLPDLREIEAIVEAVQEQGPFFPILAIKLASEHNVDDQDIYAFDMCLLDCCGLAIFEITSAAGQMLEIERAISRGKTILAVYKIRDALRREPPERTSAMIMTCPGIGRTNVWGYHRFSELGPRITDFLTRPVGILLEEDLEKDIGAIIPGLRPEQRRALVDLIAREQTGDIREALRERIKQYEG